MSKMNAQQVEALLESYGANRNAWPAHLRESIQQVINNTPVLQRRWQQARELDQALAEHRLAETQPDVAALQQTIISQLPVQPRRRRNSDSKPWIKYTGLAASLVLTLMVVFAIKPTTDESVPSPVFEQWAWQDITGQGITDEELNEPLDWMGLIELDAGA